MGVAHKPPPASPVSRQGVLRVLVPDVPGSLVRSATLTGMDIGVYFAKSRLSELIRRVQAGERIVITSHERPVAELVPYQESETE